MDVGAVIGIVVGSIVLILIIIFIVAAASRGGDASESAMIRAREVRRT
jgi:hypothetical protein